MLLLVLLKPRVEFSFGCRGSFPRAFFSASAFAYSEIMETFGESKSPTGFAKFLQRADKIHDEWRGVLFLQLFLIIMQIIALILTVFFPSNF
jgi:hypothetical protein